MTVKGHRHQRKPTEKVTHHDGGFCTSTPSARRRPHRGSKTRQRIVYLFSKTNSTRSKPSRNGKSMRSRYLASSSSSATWYVKPSASLTSKTLTFSVDKSG